MNQSDKGLDALAGELSDAELDALLRRRPDLSQIDFEVMTANVLSVVRSDLCGDVPATLPIRPAGWAVRQAVRWGGIAAVLALGLGTASVLLNERPGTVPTVTESSPSLMVERGSQTAGADPTLEAQVGQLAVTGPSVPENSSRAVEVAPSPASNVTASLNVAGPEVADVKAPQVHSNIPDYTAGVTAESRPATDPVAAVADAKPTPAE